MIKDIIFTRSENKDKASTFAQQLGGMVVASSTVFIGQDGNFSETKNSLTTGETYGLKIVDGYEKYDSNEENYGATSSYSIIEDALCHIAKMIDPQTYIISSSTVFSDEYEMLYESAETLNRTLNINIWIIEKDGRLKFFQNSK